jgi:hypothetical protein
MTRATGSSRTSTTRLEGSGLSPGERLEQHRIASTRLQLKRPQRRSLAGEADSDDAGSSLFDSDEEHPSPLHQHRGREGDADQTPVRDSSDSSSSSSSGSSGGGGGSSSSSSGSSSSSSSASSASRRVRRRHNDADRGAVTYESMSMRQKASVRAPLWESSEFFSFGLHFIRGGCVFVAWLRVFSSHAICL